MGATRSSVGDVFKLAGQSEYIGNSHRALQLKNSKMEARSGGQASRDSFFPTHNAHRSRRWCAANHRLAEGPGAPAARALQDEHRDRRAARPARGEGHPRGPLHQNALRARGAGASEDLRDFKTRRPVLACHLATPAIRHQRPLHTRRRAASRPCRLAPLAPPHTLVRATPNALARSAHR